MHGWIERCQISSNVTRIMLRRSSNVAKSVLRTVKEHPDPVEGKIKGSIPPWIWGRLLRVGPGLFEFGDTKYNHWFDGQSLVHSFTINKGKVEYRSRYLRSEVFKRNTDANRIMVNEFGTLAYPDSHKTLFQRVMATFQRLSPSNYLSDNDNINLYQIGEDIVATTESNFIHKIDPITLDTKDRIKLSDYVAINGATAHPHIEADGTVYNLGSVFKGRPHTCIVKLPSNGDGNGLATTLGNFKIICSLPSKQGMYPNYHHSFGMSENHIIITEQPVYVNIPAIMGAQVFGRAGGKIQRLFTDSDQKVHFRVVDKKTGQEHGTQYVADCFFTFHHINTFEDNGHVVVDLCCTTDENYYNFGFFDNPGGSSFIPDENRQSVRRYVLPLNTSTKSIGENLVTLNDTGATAILKDGSIQCTPDILSPLAFEFPSINYSSCNGKPYRFAYGVAGLDKLVKLDIRTRTMKMWAEKASFPSEPVFVPHPSADHEDDGVILSAVIRTELGQHPYLLILDSKTMNEIGRAEFEGVKFPKDLHGIFISRC